MMDSRQLAKAIRIDALKMVHRAGASHIGSSLSIADLLAVLYAKVLRVRASDPGWEDRDRCVLSKGHAAAVLYAVLAESGFFPAEELDRYCMENSMLLGHASHHVPGVEFSTGSLGHGLPAACGMALAGHREKKPWRVFALLSDGELDEGSNWEAALLAPQHGLDNLIVIVDYNKIQSFGSVAEVIDLKPFREKWDSFRWGSCEIDGHDHRQIEEALSAAPFRSGAPSVIIAHTVKGKGVRYMENALAWHYKSPTAAQLEEAVRQIEGDV